MGGGKKVLIICKNWGGNKKSDLSQIRNAFLGIGANLCRPVKAGEKVLNHVALKRKPYVYLLLFIYQWQGSL